VLPFERVIRKAKASSSSSAAACEVVGKGHPADVTSLAGWAAPLWAGLGRGLLPRVADLIIRETPAKLNRRFEELASVMSGQSSADSGPPRTMADLMLAHEKVS